MPETVEQLIRRSADTLGVSKVQARAIELHGQSYVLPYIAGYLAGLMECGAIQHQGNQWNIGRSNAIKHVADGKINPRDVDGRAALEFMVAAGEIDLQLNTEAKYVRS